MYAIGASVGDYNDHRAVTNSICTTFLGLGQAVLATVLVDFLFHRESTLEMLRSSSLILLRCSVMWWSSKLC